jgi:ATP synthase F1 delta subunit
MVIRKKIVARKYACAFLNLYFDAMSEDHISAFVDFYNFLRLNRGILHYLNLPGLTEEAWQDFLKRLYLQFALPKQFIRLMKVLLDGRRVGILPVVVQSVLQEFWRRKHVIHFAVVSSHELTGEEQSRVIAFLTKKTGAASIVATFDVDAALICGIVMKSETYMFEHSVARELKKFEESLLERVRL